MEMNLWGYKRKQRFCNKRNPYFSGFNRRFEKRIKINWNKQIDDLSCVDWRNKKTKRSVENYRKAESIKRKNESILEIGENRVILSDPEIQPFNEFLYRSKRDIFHFYYTTYYALVKCDSFIYLIL